MLFRNIQTIILVSACAGTTAYAEPDHRSNTTAPAAGAEEKEGVIDPKADAELHKMSDYLASLQTFSVETTAVDEKVSTDGQKIQELSQSTIAVQRPGGIRIDRTSVRGHAVLRDNGKEFTVYNLEKNIFARAPAPPTLDAAVDEARARLHIDAPGGDLLVSDPYAALVDGIKFGRYIGLEPIGEVMAHHLAMTKDKVDYQIWIQDGPQPVPLRYVITSKDMRGQPQFTIDLRNWRTNTTIPADAFTFTPPKDAKRIELPSAAKQPKGVKEKAE
jgi:hypothetical protein